MKAYVLDASAVLAWLWQENGAERVVDLLIEGGCHLSSVNLAEVVTKALDKGLPPERVPELVASLDMTMAPLETADAVEVALLRPATRHLGLSLGDRACLALAKTKSAIAVAADRSWTRIDPVLGIEIECIRGDTS